MKRTIRTYFHEPIFRELTVIAKLSTCEQNTLRIPHTQKLILNLKMASIKTESFISTVCQAMLFWITLFWSVLSGPIRTEPVKFENAALFLWLGLPSTLIRYENGLFENVFKLEEIKLNVGFALGRVWTEKFENGAFRRRRGYENHVTSLPEFSSNTNPKWPVIVAILIFSGVVWSGPHCAQSLSMHRASVCTGPQRAPDLSVHRASVCTGPQCTVLKMPFNDSL